MLSSTSYTETPRLRRDEPGNVAEQNIKLSLNSLSGKAAQSVGGSEDAPPATACPWYAAATTAGTRRRVMESPRCKTRAPLCNLTDGIVSTAPLALAIGEELGQWEGKARPAGNARRLFAKRADTYRTEDEKDHTVKTRGMRKAFKNQAEWLLEKVPPAWQVPSEPHDETTWPALDVLQTEFVTAGSAVASRGRFRVIGRWAKKPRRVDACIAGLKRRLNMLRPELYFGTADGPARRCFELVDDAGGKPRCRRVFRREQAQHAQMAGKRRYQLRA